MFNPLWTPGEQVPQTMCQPESSQVNDTRISIKQFSADILTWRWRDSLVFLLLALLPSYISRRGPEISLRAFHCCMLCRALFMLLSLPNQSLVIVILIGTDVPVCSYDLFLHPSLPLLVKSEALSIIIPGNLLGCGSLLFWWRKIKCLTEPKLV